MSKFSKIIFGIFGAGILGSSNALVIPLYSDVNLKNGAYAITSYTKPKPSKPLSFIYVGDSTSKVGKKEEKSRVYISKGKGKFGKNVYRVWLSFVNEKAFDDLVKRIKKANEEVYKEFHRKPKLSAYEAANKIAPTSGQLSLAEIDCAKKEISIISGGGSIQMRMLYHIDKKSPEINKKIYDMVCQKGKLPIIYIKE